MKKRDVAVPFPLALRFMLLLACAMLSLSVLFALLLRLSAARRQDAELEKSLALLTETLRTGGVDALSFAELAYYVTFSVYDADTRAVLATNDPLLPLLDSGGKSRTYFEADYFTDSDLSIRYKTRALLAGADGRALTVLCAIDIANDSAAAMLAAVPRLLAVALLPVLALSLMLSLLIARGTIAAFKALRADYDREKAFTSNVSHELKTPIAVISGHAALLRRWGKDDPAQLAASIDAIAREAEQMGGIVTTLLELSRLEQGRLAVEKTRVPVAGFFARLKAEFAAVYPAMQIDALADAAAVVVTDEPKLRQIFTVIVANSAKFAGERCHVVLAARRAGSRMELSAADDGAGFADGVLPHVFERFYKGDTAHTRNAGGAGLGLSIAKTLAEALGGEIRAENAPAGGAVIRVLLPA